MKSSEAGILGALALLFLGGGDSGGSASGGITTPGGGEPTRVPGGGIDGPGGEEPFNVGPAQINPGAVWASYIRDTPTIGYLYTIRPGDSPTGVARDALGVGVGSPRTVPYLRSMTLSRWNWMLYATEADGTYSVQWPGQPVRGFIGPAAWLPGNDDVQAAFLMRELPHRRYAFARDKNPNDGSFLSPKSNGRPFHGASPTFGTIFLPPEPPGDPNAADRNPKGLLDFLGKTIMQLTPNL